ncbi:MAG: hypothetical protein KF773_06295 [Deltaproteobacteria bacterium]|nr:hypothetical protein [Deltaproteobacteria bacterium]
MRRALLVILPITLALAACGDDGIDGQPGTYSVSGVVRYEDRPALATALLGDPVPVPARFIEVAVIAEDDGATLATGTTDAAGKYTLTFDGVGGEAVHVLAIPSSSDPARPISVKHVDPVTGIAKELHGFGGETFKAGIVTTHDVLITAASGEGGAFNIFDTLVVVMDRVPAAFNVTNPPPVTALWQVGSDDGTYYLDGDHEIHLLGEEVDGDEYDDSVIAHEAGHYIEDVIGRTDNPGGDHDGSPTDPRLAWSEGFATYFALVITDSAVYIDTARDGGFTFDGEASVTRAVANGGIGQDVSEDMVTEILYDMGDGLGDDPLDGTHDAVLALQPFLRTATLRAAGTPGMDLVDALDGWFVKNGLASCAAIRTIVVATRLFPYDFGGAAGACPP